MPHQIKHLTKPALFCAILAVCTSTLAQDRIANFADAARAKTTRDFLDPDSAKFRDLEVREWIGDGNKKHLRLCGQVNAKNKMGAYVGFRTFSADEDTARIADPDAAELAQGIENIMHNAMCGPKTKLLRKIK